MLCSVRKNFPYVMRLLNFMHCLYQIVSNVYVSLILLFQTPDRYTMSKRILILEQKQGIIQPDLKLNPSGYCLLTLHCRGTQQSPCSSWKLVLYSHNKLLFQQSKHSPTGKHYHLKQILFHACESNLQSFS